MRKICVFTGTRAEYGLLYWVMKYIQNDPELDLQTVVTGAHLSPSLGLTWQMIEQDGFVINAKVPMDLDDDSDVGLVQAMGQELCGLSKTLDILRPDILVILGDRYEALIAATTAMMLRIPVAHIHGGETTEGAIDEAIRHAITKMSHLHFPAADDYRHRIIQLGEAPERVFNCGAPGLDHIEATNWMDCQELSQSLEFDLTGDVALVTYHPVTLENETPFKGLDALLQALAEFDTLKVVFTKANADMLGQQINARIEDFVADHSDRMILTPSLGQRRYLSMAKMAKMVVGNSSSGLIEVPALATPTVNLGSRQQGRLRAASVIDCTETVAEIKRAFDKALSPDFQKEVQAKESPYGAGGASRKIVDVLKAADLEDILVKKFYNVENSSL